MRELLWEGSIMPSLPPSASLRRIFAVSNVKVKYSLFSYTSLIAQNHASHVFALYSVSGTDFVVSGFLIAFLFFFFLREEADVTSIIWPKSTCRTHFLMSGPFVRCGSCCVYPEFLLLPLSFGELLLPEFFLIAVTSVVGLYAKSGSLPWWWLIWGMDKQPRHGWLKSFYEIQSEDIEREKHLLL